MPKSKDIQLQALPVFVYRGQIVTDSRDAAAVIGKPHKVILRQVRTMQAHLSGHNFAPADFFIPATYTDEQGKPRPCYYLTQMGCEMIANKQTGAAGTLFTAQYVKVFHAMKEFILERNSPIWQDTRELTKAVRKQETDAIREYVEYATAQGSTHAVRYYTSISRLANKTAGITDRDLAHVEQLSGLMLVERIIAEEIRAGIAAGKPYKQIYTDLQARLSSINALISPVEGAQSLLTDGEYKHTTEEQNAVESL